MVENLIRIREPLAWALVLLTALAFVLQAAQIVWYLAESVQWYPVGDGDGGLLSVDWIFGWLGADHALILALALVVAVAGCCSAPPVPRARPLALTAAWIATVTVAFPWLVVAVALLARPSAVLGSGIPWQWWMSISLLAPLATTGVGAVAAVALWALARRPPEQAEDLTELESADPAESDEPSDEHPTVWKPAEATGTVWRTADEAAAGSPGTQSFLPGDPAPHTPRRSHAAEPGPASPGAEWAQDATGSAPPAGQDWRPPTTL